MQFDRDMGTFKVMQAKYAEAPAEISREKMTRADEIIPPKKEKEGSGRPENGGVSEGMRVRWVCVLGGNILGCTRTVQ